MTEPEDPKWTSSDPKRTRSRRNEFRETLASPMPNRTYRSDVDLIDGRPSVIEQLVRYAAGILIILIGIRFIINLFTLTRSGTWVSFFYITTDWAVRPFQGLFGQPSVISAGGFVDWAALASIIVVSIIAWILVLLLRPRAAHK